MLIQCGELRCKSMMCGKRLQSQLWFLAAFFPPFIFCTFFLPDGGVNTFGFFFSSHVQHLPCTVIRHLSVASWKLCWTQNADRVSSSRLKWQSNYLESLRIAVRITGCFVADCGSWVGDSRPNPTRDVTLSPLISTPSSVPHPKRKVTIEEIPKSMYPKSHEGQQ